MGWESQCWVGFSTLDKSIRLTSSIVERFMKEYEELRIGSLHSGSHCHAARLTQQGPPATTRPSATRPNRTDALCPHLPRLTSKLNRLCVWVKESGPRVCTTANTSGSLTIWPRCRESALGVSERGGSNQKIWENKIQTIIRKIKMCHNTNQ